MRPSSPAHETPASAIAALAEAYWEGRLEAGPVEATLLGYRHYDDRLDDISEAGHQREVARLEGLLAEVQAVDTGALSEADRITRDLLVGELESDLAQQACRLHAWTVDSRSGPQIDFFTLGKLQTVSTPAQARALLARWRKMPAYIDQRVENLRMSLKAGKVAPEESVRRVIQQLEELLSKPDSEWALMAPRDAAHPPLPAAEQEAFASGIDEAIASIRAAIQRYRGALVREILPHARDDAHVGLLHIPDGPACYARLIQVHTSLDLSAEEIHRIGLDEVARVREEMQVIGQRALGTSELPEIQRRLRTDPAMFFSTRDEVEQKAARALARASSAFSRWFSDVPAAPCVVKRIEPFEEKDSTIAYYRQPAVDGSRPGTYYINTYAPETRPRYEAEVLAFHESVPGHHSQIALAQELGDVPEFRRHAGVTAYVEGWALYTERLADEMGLYSGDLDRLGMLSFDAWRASRLVVDTGLHAKGWSRKQAVAYMLENTLLAENNIANEVDRYINWPGQALAYKLGQREIQALRADAERKLGPKFSIQGFHHAVLGAGAISLPILRRRIQRWVAAVEPARP